MSAENARGAAAGSVVSVADRRSIISLAVAGGSVTGVIAVIVGVWREIGDVQISTAGWVMMALGILATLFVGIGLMALVFISSRRGYDEPSAIRPERSYTDQESAKWRE